MSKKKLFSILIMVSIFVCSTKNIDAQTLGTDFFDLGSDNTSNYSSWNDGDNFGNGFGPWTFNTTGGGGHYLGGTGQGNPSFGIFAGGNSGNTATASRNFSSALKLGDRFSVDIGHSNSIANGGEVVLQLLDDGNPVITLKFVGGTSNWQLNDGGSDFGIAQGYSAQNSLSFTFTYNEDGTYSYTFGSASGNNFTANNTISGINGFRFQSIAQGGGENAGMNNMSIDSKYTITNSSTVNITTTTSVPYLTVQNGNTVNLDANIGLTIADDLTNNGTIAANSGSSIIVNGTSTGNITYNRMLSSTNWHIIGSPAAGETIEDLISNNPFGTGPNNRVGLATYDNSQTDINDRWIFRTSNSTGAIVQGTGYIAKLSSPSNLNFIGTIATTDIGVAITDGTGSGGDAFNMISNPYPSFIAANSNANATNNLLSTNSGSLTEDTLWFWNQSNNSYDIINQASPSFQIAPGQGFFVSANASNMFSFTEPMQSHQATDSFQRNSNTRPEIKLLMSDEISKNSAKLFYINGTTVGFDNGFDSSIFDETNSTFSIYSLMLANNSDKKLGIQSLPNSDFESTIVPIGFNADSGKNLTFSAETKNLPNGIKLFLEDRKLNTYTCLEETNSNYKFTLVDDSDKTGRFFIHTTSKLLNIKQDVLNSVSIFTSNKNLKIAGLQNKNVTIKVFNIFGKQVLNQSFTASVTKDISLHNLVSGVYIVKLNNDEGTISKKIILE